MVNRRNQEWNPDCPEGEIAYNEILEVRDEYISEEAYDSYAGASSAWGAGDSESYELQQWVDDMEDDVLMYEAGIIAEEEIGKRKNVAGWVMPGNKKGPQ